MNIIQILKDADDEYFNDGESSLTDEQYDTLKASARQQWPNDPYFNNTGVAIRGSKIPLPVPMGSLTQCYNDTDINKWKSDDCQYVLSDKLDGVSVMLEYHDGRLSRAYSRGDGFEGADITRHIIKLDVPKTLDKSYALIRCEAIIPINKFDLLRSVNAQVGKYKAARNAVAGMMNAKTNDINVYQYIDIVAYELTSEKASSKLSQLQYLQQHFKNVVNYQVSNNINSKILTDITLQRKLDSIYELDGIVVDIDSSDVRHAQEFDGTSINPGYSFKFKVQATPTATTVLQVVWNISRHRTLIPTILVEPFNYNGVTISKTSGFNAKYIIENGIGPGAVVNMVRSGEVIPYIISVDKSVEPQLPDMDFIWDETKTNIIASDVSTHFEVIHLNRLEYFFSTLGVDQLKEGNIKKLFEHNIFEIEDIIKLTEFEWRQLIGANGVKVFNSIRTQLANIELYKLMGAFPFFDKGLGVRKFKALEKAFGTERLLDNPPLVKEICTIDGFDIKTATKIIDGYDQFFSFIDNCKDYITIKRVKNTSGDKFKDQNIVFTGFRDKVLESLIESQGGVVKSSVSKKTTLVVANDINETSSKLTNARELGIPIISKLEFLQQFS